MEYSQENDIRVISLGGSIVAPDGIDTKFLTQFRDFIDTWLESSPQSKLIFVIGGGGVARSYQNAYKELVPSPDTTAMDYIGIRATRLNAEFVRAVFTKNCVDPIVTDPEGDHPFTGRVLVASGWKPGFSTDNVAVRLAKKFNSTVFYNLSNIKKVFTADPKKDLNAKPLDSLTWTDYKKMVGDKWVPGANAPFDPIATKHAEEMGLNVMVAYGRDIPNLSKLFNGEKFEGSIIRP